MKLLRWKRSSTRMKKKTQGLQATQGYQKGSY